MVFPDRYGTLDELTELAFSPDSTQLATASEDRSARVWDVRTGALVTVLQDRIGLRQADGSIQGNVRPARLVELGCARARELGAADLVSELCTPRSAP